MFDPDQGRQNVVHDLDPNHLTILVVNLPDLASVSQLRNDEKISGSLRFRPKKYLLFFNSYVPFLCLVNDSYRTEEIKV